MKKTIIIILPIIFVVILYIGLSFYITNLAFQAERKLPEEDPGNYGLPYEEISFKSSDPKEIILKGWWIPSIKSRGTIIWVHGLDGERSGGEGKLEMIKEINQIGFSVLTFDLRGHGISGDAPLGLGIREKNDIYGAINFLRQDKDIEKVGLWGISYGAVAVIDSAVNEPESGGIVGVIADTPYFSVPELLSKEVSDRTPIPKLIADLLKFGIIKSGEILHDMNINDVSNSMSKNNQIDFPLMILGCMNDERVPISHPDRVYSYARHGSEYYKFRDCEDHGKAYESNKIEYMKLFNKYFTSRFEGEK
ncbi:MAG: alpha/beta fold hydrolase [Chloroflexota bacterium]